MGVRLVDFSDDLFVFDAVWSWAKPTLLLFGSLSRQNGGRLKMGEAGFITTAVAWALPAELTFRFVLCPLPSPLPRGEGDELAGKLQVAEKPKMVQL